MAQPIPPPPIVNPARSAGRPGSVRMTSYLPDGTEPPPPPITENETQPPPISRSERVRLQESVVARADLIHGTRRRRLLGHDMGDG